MHSQGYIALWTLLGSDSRILAYSDAGDVGTRKSTTGYEAWIIDDHMGLTTGDGSTIHNGGRVHSSLSNSQGADLGKEVVSRPDTVQGSELYVDNQSTLRLIKNPEFQAEQA